MGEGDTRLFYDTAEVKDHLPLRIPIFTLLFITSVLPAYFSFLLSQAQSLTVKNLLLGFLSSFI
jgi:hypothetical protein